MSVRSKIYYMPSFALEDIYYKMSAYHHHNINSTDQAPTIEEVTDHPEQFDFDSETPREILNRYMSHMKNDVNNRQNGDDMPFERNKDLSKDMRGSQLKSKSYVPNQDNIELNIQVNNNVKQRPVSVISNNPFALRTPEETQAFYQQLRTSKGHEQMINEEEDARQRTESMENEMMYQVYDTEEGKYLDIRDLEREICVVDSTTYFDKRHAQKFTTISMKSRFRTMWEDFWTKKDKTNIKLIRAAATGNTKQIKKLLNKLREGEKVADLNFCDDEGYSALHAAAKFNQYDSMQLIISSGEADVNMYTHNEQRLTALHIATLEQHILLVKMLLQEFKADVDVQDGSNNTPLHYAVMQGNIKLLKVILTKFPRIDLTNFEGNTVVQLPMKLDIKSEINAYSTKLQRKIQQEFGQGMPQMNYQPFSLTEKSKLPPGGPSSLQPGQAVYSSIHNELINLINESASLCLINHSDQWLFCVNRLLWLSFKCISQQQILRAL